MTRIISPAPGTLRSIQRGTISLNAASPSDATVSAVTTSKARLKFLGCDNYLTQSSASTTDISTLKHYGVRLTLVNSTTVRATYGGATSGQSVSWELEETY